MTSSQPGRFTETQRMEVRSYVQLAADAVAQFWPMRTFIHHNPLHGFESQPFEEGVAQGRRLFGGRAYLPNDEYRRCLKAGRLREPDLRAVLRTRIREESVQFAGRILTHADLLIASMVDGLTEDPSPFPGDTDLVARRRLAEWLRTVRPSLLDGPLSGGPPSDESAAGETLGTWCDDTLGTAIVDTVNQEMIKWCSAFLDEGEAAWTMPGREQTFYRAWRSLARHDASFRLIGIRDVTARLDGLPDRPEDALLQTLAALRIPINEWERYLTLHLSALLGWTGYIKWRAQQTEFPWQEEYPIDLVKYLAVRLFYEHALVENACRRHLGISGRRDEIRCYMAVHPDAYRLRRGWVAGLVPESLDPDVRRLARALEPNHGAWDEVGQRYAEYRRDEDRNRALDRAAQWLLRLAQVMSIETDAIESTDPADLYKLLEWLVEFPPSEHGPVWLTAYESAHRSTVLRALAPAVADGDPPQPDDPQASTRPLAQVIFCIDVRSEVFRRHLEHLGGYETLGLAGFFGVPLDYVPFSAQHAVAHCPVLLKPKNRVREIPRSYHGALAERHRTAAHIGEAARELLHDLKENVVTPYVMVEALGWLFGVPLFGKTLFPRWYGRAKQWLQRAFLPDVATTLTVEKLNREDALEMVAAEQRAAIRAVVRERFGVTGAALSSTLLDKIRRNVLGQEEGSNGDVAHLLKLDQPAEAAFYAELRERYQISPRGVSARLERLTHTGFSTVEQAYFVEAALRLMGLTQSFARLVVFCAHGSTSENNPYESALDCGACGGNHGLANARTIAAMANKAAVRDLLRARGISIPNDSHFAAATHDTTSDTVRIVDLEDVPATHRKDLQRLLADLEEAGRQAAHERIASLLSVAPSDPRRARWEAARRGCDWGETRPEWGLSKNSLILIGRRALTHGVNLRGRSFLHSYDWRQDASGKLLETIMTAPLVVAQWINMEHYFSTVDNEVYGSGSKIYHNVVGRVGVMTGSSSDLRIGLPAQTVLQGPVPYHEPMRLLAIIEAPRDRIEAVIARHPLLDHLFHGRWISLTALDPRDRRFYRFVPGAGWTVEPKEVGGPHHDGIVTASHEGDQDRRSGRTLEVCH